MANNIAIHMEAVARRLLGDPSKATKDELRFGTHGSLKINLKLGTWYDHENQVGGGVLSLIEARAKVSNGHAVEWLREQLGVTVESNAHQPIESYDYTDEGGNTLFQVLRYEPKDFRQRRPIDNGGWDWSIKGVRQVPYRLPAILNASERTIHIVEGEKDVHALERLELIATCNAGGAGKWRPEFSKFFVGADVVIIPDNDPAGEDHAKKVADLLASSAEHIRIIHLPGLPPKGDVSDWIRKGGTAEKLARLCDGEKPRDPREERITTLNLVSTEALLEQEFREPKWAVPDLVPEGLSLLAGKPKTGKSWLALDLGLSVALGGYALGNIKCEAGDVLYLALEDTLRRLHSRVKAVLQGEPAPKEMVIGTEWKRTDEGGLDDIRIWLQLHPNARLVVVDTLQKMRGARKRDAGVYEDDYRAVAEFKKVADEFTVPIILVHHQNKAGNSDPIMAVSGTAGITGATDTIITLEREANDPNGVLKVKGRDIEELEIAIRFDGDTGKWLKLGKAQDWRISEERRAVIKLLMELGPMFPREIAESVGKKAASIRVMLHRMVKDESVRLCEDGRYSA